MKFYFYLIHVIVFLLATFQNSNAQVISEVVNILTKERKTKKSVHYKILISLRKKKHYLKPKLKLSQNTF